MLINSSTGAQKKRNFEMTKNLSIFLTALLCKVQVRRHKLQTAPLEAPPKHLEPMLAGDAVGVTVIGEVG
jgi:hypothetical protein